mgnify:CR=1 FL=1
MDNKVLDLLEIRDQIDGIDKEIVELFGKTDAAECRGGGI